MSDSNLSTLAFQEEPRWNVAPTPLNLQRLRFTKETLDHKKGTVLSNEIRGDRQRSDLVEVSQDGAGDITAEFSGNTYDAFLQAALMSTFGTAATGTFSGAVVDGDTVTIDGKAWTFQAVLTDVDGNVQLGANAQASMANLVAAINCDIVTGTPVYAPTAATPSRSTYAVLTFDGKCLVTAINGGTAGNAIAVATTSGVGAWTGAATHLAGGANTKTMGNGVQRRSFTIEKCLKAGSFVTFPGMMLSQMTFTLNSRQIAMLLHDLPGTGRPTTRATSRSTPGVVLHGGHDDPDPVGLAEHRPDHRGR